MTRQWCLGIAAFALMLPAVLTGASAGEQMLAALRMNDKAALHRLLASGAPAGTTDETGASALMYAAVYSDAATMKALLDRGADPNHTDNAGSTALIWAIPDVEKMKLLLARGAQADLPAKLSGRTPLLVACGRPGAAAAVRLLLDKGADGRARDHRGETALTRAAYSNDTEVMRLVLDRSGADINATVEAGQDFQVSALMQAAFQGNTKMVEMLLARGADSRFRNSLGFNVLNFAVSYEDFTPYRLLAAKGADPRVRHAGGQDLLMAAAASDQTTAAAIREIAGLGCDVKASAPNLHTAHGYGKEPESALDWAMRHGATPAAKALMELGGTARREEKIAEPRLKAGSIRAAIEKALPPLYAGGREFFKRSGCTSCHHNHLAALAFSEARKRGAGVDQEQAQRNYQQSAAWLRGSQQGMFQDVTFPGENTTSGYVSLALEAQGHKPDRSTDALVHELAVSQAADGSWHVSADRPPIESRRVTPTALAIHALRVYGIPGRKPEFDRRVRRGVEWLTSYRARTGEELSMRLLGLSWGGAKGAGVREAAKQLAGTQRPDGGWAQLETLPSDAYATGQALYALHTAGHLEEGALRKAIQFLLNEQLADGTWHVRSRSYPLQPKYFDTGFPGGRDQWISAAATSWAVVGLSLGLTP